MAIARTRWEHNCANSVGLEQRKQLKCGQHLEIKCQLQVCVFSGRYLNILSWMSEETIIFVKEKELRSPDHLLE